MYQCLETLRIKAANKEDFSEELDLTVKIYDSDINENDLIMAKTFNQIMICSAKSLN